MVRALAHAAYACAQPIESGEWWDRPAAPFLFVLQSLLADAGVVVRAPWLAAEAEISDPEVSKQFPESVNSNWRQAWGIP